MKNEAHGDSIRGELAVGAAASLRDPVRAKLYGLIGARDAAVSRDEAAEAVGMPRSTVAFHLDRMVESGLLEVEYRRRSGKGGPGAGRPAKLYRRAARVIALSLPERRFDVVGHVLAGAVEKAQETGTSVGAAVAQVAQEAGAQAAAGHTDLLAALQAGGYEPRAEENGDVVFGNCPFDELAEEHRDLVCSLNLNLVRGMAGTCGAESRIRQDAAAGRCCVRAVGLLGDQKPGA